LFNEHFGQGTISLDYVLHDMPSDAYVAWWAYFIEHAKQVDLNKAQAEHDDTMTKVARAAAR
jgi:hypothetical protein